MSSEPAGTDVPAETARAEPVVAPPRRKWRRWAALVAVVLVLDVVAFVAFPQTPKGSAPGTECAFPACFIANSLEFPAPHTVLDLAPATAPAAGDLITFHPSISSTLLTMWIVMAIVIGGAVLMTRRATLVPRGGQNVFEAVYEGLSDFGLGISGPAGRPYIPIFIGAFLLILFDNWIGLVPPVGKIDLLRAPSSDVNVTIGMALVSFLIFHIEGFRRLGVRGYLGKFFPFYEFRNGIGAGIIAMFVGLIETMLEFVKPVTLSMRLFGNIYGGEVGLGVITTLTVSGIPLFLLALELMLNVIQALIFSILTLIFITLAIESHDDAEGHIAEEVMADLGRAPSSLQPSH